MNSLLEKEGMGGKVQMVYFDPPYGIKYGSNFQPFVNKRDVKDGKDEDLTAEPEMIKAFRDTWELGIHSYLSYLRDRLLLAKELLSESGSIFVQISDENVHHVKELMAEVFGGDNFVRLVTFQKTSGQETKVLASTVDFLVWFAKDYSKIKYHQLYEERAVGDTSLDRYDMFLTDDGESRRLTTDELSTGTVQGKGKRYQLAALYSDGASSSDQAFEFRGTTYRPRSDTHWKTTLDGMQRLADVNRIEVMGSVIRYRRYVDDFPVIPITDRWESMMLGTKKNYIVETSYKVIQHCTLMTTDPGDLVLDITCGSGTTAFVAENWGRRWITCDTSRVATALAKQRLMTADFDYFELAHPDEGVGSGFKYKTVPHVTLKSIANNEPAPQETLYDQPFIDNKKLRITGPFTVEAVPSATVVDSGQWSVDSEETADASIARSGETLRQAEWIDRLKDGVRGKGGGKIEFTRVEQLGGTHFLQAEAETKPSTTPSAEAAATPPVQEGSLKPQRVVICFGPEHAPLEQRLVEHAIQEAQTLVPKPEMVLFCAFQFDPEARKDIDEMNWPGVRLLEAQMDADLSMDDLKKKPRDKSNPAFWLIGQPDVELTDSGQRTADNEPLFTVTVKGFDYYNPKTGQVESGGKSDIAMWMLDPDYDDRSLFPTQVFFPMAGDKEGWSKLAKNLKAEIDEEKIEAFRGTESLPFKPGRKVAVKIIDARGIESLKIIHF